MIYLKDMGLKNGLDSTKYKKALDFSYNFYRKKSRKGQRFPYFTFLSSVSNLIIENNGTTDEAIAGLFHDILEDETGSVASDGSADVGIKLENEFGFLLEEAGGGMAADLTLTLDSDATMTVS